MITMLRICTKACISYNTFSRSFSLGPRLYKENSAESKKKWTQSRLEPLLAWNQDTNGIFGPIIKAGAEKKVEKIKKKKEKESLLNDKNEKVKILDKEINEKQYLDKKIKNDPECHGEILNTEKKCQKVERNEEQKCQEVINKKKEIKKEKKAKSENIKKSKKSQNADNHEQTKFVYVPPSDTCDYEEITADMAMQLRKACIPTEKKIAKIPTPSTLHSLSSPPLSVSHNTSSSSSPVQPVNFILDNISVASKTKFQNYERSYSTDVEVTPVNNILHLESPTPCINSLAVDLPDDSENDFVSAILRYPLFGVPAPMMDSGSSFFPGVATVLKDTMSPESKYFLDRWEKEKIAELGLAGFQKFKSDMFANGNNLHASIQKLLSGQSDIDLRPANEGHWESFQPIFEDITDVLCLERTVKHSDLQYKGILDCVATYRGKVCIVDWKTSQRRKPELRHTYDNPLQLVAYLSAFNNLHELASPVEHCLLVIGYPDGNLADVHLMNKMDCMNYWSAWLQRLQAFWSKFHSAQQQKQIISNSSSSSSSSI